MMDITSTEQGHDHQSGSHRNKRYIHWKESQMEKLSKYLETHVDYATSPSLESCFYIKRDVFPDEDEVTPKRLFGKICNMRAAFKRSARANNDDANSKKKRKRRHSHMDQIYSTEYLDSTPNTANNDPVQTQNSRWTPMIRQVLGAGGGNLSARLTTGSRPESLSTESMETLLRANLVEQLNYWDGVTSRVFREKTPQDLLIEFLHKKMEQDAELNRLLIESTERMVKAQADAQVQSATLLKKCAITLRSLENGQKSDDSEDDSELDDDDDELVN